jgi:hypothetical protein
LSCKALTKSKCGMRGPPIFGQADAARSPGRHERGHVESIGQCHSKPANPKRLVAFRHQPFIGFNSSSTTGLATALPAAIQT